MASSNKALARKIPADVRSQLLTKDIVFKAKNEMDDPALLLLYRLWRTYIDPTASEDIEGCGACRQTMISNWKALQEGMIELEREDNILNEI